MNKKEYKGFTLIEMIVVVIIIGILLYIFSHYMKKIDDVNSYKNIFLEKLNKEIFENQKKINGEIYYELPIQKLCGGEPGLCKWKDGCIIDKADFSFIEKEIKIKKLIKMTTKYVLCPKYVKDPSNGNKKVLNKTTINDIIPSNPIHSNPSYILKFKFQGENQFIQYPFY